MTELSINPMIDHRKGKLDKIENFMAILLLLGFILGIILQYSTLEFIPTNDDNWRIEILAEQYYQSFHHILLLLSLILTILPSFFFIPTSLRMQSQFMGSRIYRGRDFLRFIGWSQSLLGIFYFVSFFIPSYMLENQIYLLFEPFIAHIFMLFAFLLTVFHKRQGIGLQTGFSWFKALIFIIVIYLSIGLFIDLLVTEPIAKLFDLELVSWREEQISQEILGASQNGWLGSIFEILMIGLLVPIAEEIMFRGLIQTIIHRKLGKWVGMILTALLFALIHVDLSLLAPLFVIGMVLSWLKVYFNSLWPPIMFHILMNSISTFIYLIQ
ncbi:CPBP family intramembrane glutamic endopeptidase [Tepidibacillus sp. HK-1]|uniref:CPBP family intramembrane glutamic endopeptidase n=1 Tax=Tepidibacillus sp. HK-1 TaxID=1883407 RepID=UPI0008533F60|nr:type II CAAX endopeptidase family protein [Tepidibacillus sp. HK-1]GBF11432.1 CAAX amino terminal protease self- immunity [Tepidibacillus sp. HK-1]